MTSAGHADPVRVAYLVSQYPALSHTFIETEIEALRARGVEVRTFTIRPCPEDQLLSPRARAEARATTVLVEDAARTLPAATLALLRRSPGAIVAGVRAAFRNGRGGLRPRLRQLFYLGEAIILWRRMTAAGLRHVHVHFANNGADVARLTVVLGASADGDGAGWRWSLTMHGPTEFEDQTRYDLARKLASAASVACISDYCRSQVMRLLDPEDWPKLGIVRMAVDTERFQPVSQDGSPDAQGSDGAAPLRVLSVGRLVPEKGAPLLLDCVAELRARGVPVQLTIVGSGPLHDVLAARIDSAQLTDAVSLAGPVGQGELASLYRRADVFCLPSFAEGLPVVLMEAMASALPVVSTVIAGIPELVADGRTGLLVAPGRADLLALALSRLAADRVLAADLGAAGRRAVLERHQPGDNVTRLVALWLATGCAR